MKQHITISQFSELNDKAKLKLHEWCVENGHVVITQDLSSTLEVPRLLLSIGQMIEFLEENLKRYGDTPKFSISEGNEYSVIPSYKDNFHRKVYSSKELCDALWEAVKESLEA